MSGYLVLAIQTDIVNINFSRFGGSLKGGVKILNVGSLAK